MEYGEEDNCLFGKVLGLKKDCITYEGEIISELKSDFEGAIPVSYTHLTLPTILRV